MSASSMGDKRAVTILRELHAAEKELVGKAVVLTDGKAGTIEKRVPRRCARASYIDQWT